MSGGFAGLVAVFLASARGEVPKQAPGPSAPDTPAEALAAAPSPPDLRGTWRFELIVVTHASIPVLGTTTVESRTLFLTRVAGSVRSPVIDAVACQIQVEPSRAIAVTTVPQEFVDAIPPKHTPAVLTWHEDRWRFQADMRPQPLGYAPEASGGELPQRPGDPGITDLEGDGHPGGTIHLDAPLFGQIDLYVVQHAHTVLDGTWTGAHDWTGEATVHDFGQRTIGASNRLFMANADISVDQEHSRFRWARVAEGTECAALRDGVGTR